MKCNICKGRLNRIVTDTTCTIDNQTYQVLNVPVRVCKDCNQTYIDAFIMRLLHRYSKSVNNGVIDFRKMKDDEDAASAASAGIMF